jgi:hypothetical protein
MIHADILILILLACIAIPAIIMDGASSALARRMDEGDEA